MVISSGKATFGELSTTLGIEAMHDIVEVILIDAHNRRIQAEREQRKRRKE